MTRSNRAGGQPKPIEFGEVELQTLCASALFRGYSRSDVVRLLPQLDVRRLECSDGEIVADEQDTPTRMGVLLSGFLHVYDSALRGRRHLVRIVRPGEALGATLAGVVSPRSYPALVEAYGNCIVATLSLEEIAKLMKSGGGAFYTNLSSVIYDEFQACWQKIAILSCQKIEDRLLLYLQHRSRLEKSKSFAIGSTESEFADYLGVSREALARTLRRLSKEGHFLYRRDVFTLP